MKSLMCLILTLFFIYFTVESKSHIHFDHNAASCEKCHHSSSTQFIGAAGIENISKPQVIQKKLIFEITRSLFIFNSIQPNIYITGPPTLNS